MFVSTPFAEGVICQLPAWGQFTMQSSRNEEQLRSFRLTGVGGQMLTLSLLK